MVEVVAEEAECGVRGGGSQLSAGGNLLVGALAIASAYKRNIWGSFSYLLCCG